MASRRFDRGMAAFGAGVGPCGHDPEDELEGATPQETIEAHKFDPYDRLYKLNANYSAVGDSPAIQRAAHLMLPLGAIPAVATSGLDIQAIRRAPPDIRLAVIEDALRRTWKVLLETNQIAMGKVTLINEGPPWSGRFEVEVIDLLRQKDTTLEGKVT